MYSIKKFEVWASEIAGFLNCELVGNDFLIDGPSHIRVGSSRKAVLDPCESPDKNILLLTENPPEGEFCIAYLLTPRPELSLGYVLREFFASKSVHSIHATAVISEEATVGRNVKIGPHSVIGPDVVIGDNTIIMSNVVINGPVTVGKNCVIKDGAVIGSEGWGFVDDDDGVPFHPPQLGKIVIEDNVWLGSNSTIERAMIAKTLVSANVKIDDLVHVGGAAQIGKRCMITAGSVIAYNVIMGDDVTVSPQSVIRENLKIGDRVMIGQGTVVISDLTSPGVYVGNPARFLKLANNENKKRQLT